MRSLDIHLIGICGTGMGSFAGLLKAAGHRVRGSDQNVYPPMSTKLEEWGIPVMKGYRPENLDPAPDLVVVGNVIPRINPEATAVRERGLEQVSFPDALGRLFLTGRRSLVVSGTHGKTTTSSLLAWLLSHAGRDPSFLIGGVPANFGEGFRLGQGPAFVVEGDEYDTAYFDKRPKFLLYQPAVAIVTSIEFDHADIYPDLETIERRFDELVALVPPASDGGRILACATYPNVAARRASARSDTSWETYSARPDLSADWTATAIQPSPAGLDFDLCHQGRVLRRLHLPLSGRHNLENAIASAACALGEGLSLEEVDEALRTFKGIARRQTVRAVVRGITLIDDFAHHPTAVRETLEGLKDRYPGQRLLAVFEPRTATSARAHFQSAYAEAFDAATNVILAPVGRPELGPDERLDVQKLASEISDRGIPTEAAPDLETIVERIAQTAKEGDIVVFMSNGGFGGIHERVESALQDHSSS